ncbi:MAG: DUF1080 domain-containing protein [Chitinophagaceae bacterium]
MTKKIFLALFCCTGFIMTKAQAPAAKHEDTEFYTPVPKVVTPGKTAADAPSDAVILFDGKNLDQWKSSKDDSPAKWIVSDGMFTVKKGTGSIQTKQSFSNYQLHIEWKIPTGITGSGQSRGNSGVFLASLGRGDEGYELQVLDNYKNDTYVNGMAGSIYKQLIPLANVNRPPGEWQSYDVLWTAPTFNEDGVVKTPANVTVIFNGVVVQNHAVLTGGTKYIGQPSYTKHGPAPIMLQDHGDPSAAISYRNIWIRPL